MSALLEIKNTRPTSQRTAPQWIAGRRPQKGRGKRDEESGPRCRYSVLLFFIFFLGIAEVLGRSKRRRVACAPYKLHGSSSGFPDWLHKALAAKTGGITHCREFLLDVGVRRRRSRLFRFVFSFIYRLSVVDGKLLLATVGKGKRTERGRSSYNRFDTRSFTQTYYTSVIVCPFTFIQSLGATSIAG